MKTILQKSQNIQLEIPAPQTVINTYPTLFQKLFQNNFITFRSLKHIIKIAISICRLNGYEQLSKEVLLEACQYRKTHLFEN